MYLAYFDESGDSGLPDPLGKSPTTPFVLSCLLVPAEHWMDALNTLVEWRRELKEKFNIPSRSEIKAIQMRKGQGPLLPLKWARVRRMKLYRAFLRHAANELPYVRVFAIVIDKAGAHGRNAEPRETAWTYAIQRLHRHSVKENSYTMVFPDEGHGEFIRKLMRKMRRHHFVKKHWGRGRIEFKTERVVEDPNDRRSHDSYFIQLADWCAYAAHRSKYVLPMPGVPDNLWDELASILHPEVNSLKGGPPGIVLYPMEEPGLADDV